MKSIWPFVIFAIFVPFVVAGSAQSDVTDAELERASNGRTVRLGPARGGPAATLPIEVYVARVLAGEGEPRAPEAAHQALAVAIRTYALANLGRHARDGFDVCDSTHCQVPRAATTASRRATLMTAGQLLTYAGAPAELFYSASCGGYSESAGQVWPGADYPYLQAAPDDVHEGDVPWTIEVTLETIERALERVGFEGRLHDVRVDERTSSGRAARLALPGLVPDVIAGDQFRAAIGTTTLRSTAFSVDTKGTDVRFTGRGYGHGVGMCVIGAGRRAGRGESMQAILGQYYPGLQLTSLAVVGRVPRSGPAIPRNGSDTAVSGPAIPRSGPDTAVSGPAVRTGIIARVPSSSSLTAAELERTTARAHDELSRTLGVSMAPITVRVHESIESFRLATGRPWWVGSVSDGTSIDLVPAALLAQREGVDAAVRTAVAELLVSRPFNGRPLWIRVGAARYFGRDPSQPRPGVPSPRAAQVRCPSDAELALAISAAAHRDAAARAETCFARQYADRSDWRSVK